MTDGRARTREAQRSEGDRREQLLAPPIAPRTDHESVVHGDVRVDPYFWLRDRDDPRVMHYLEAENAYTDAVMAPTKDMQERLYTEILSRIQETDPWPPPRRPPYLYYSRTEE